MSVGPGEVLGQMEQTEPSPGVTSERFAVTTETVVFGIGNDSGSHAVQVDVRGNRPESMGRRLDEVTFEAFSPQGSKAVVRVIEPDGKALLEQFGETGDITHQSELTLSPLHSKRAVLGKLGANDLQTSGLKPGGTRIKDRVAAEQLVVGNGLLLGDQHQNVEVIAKKSVSNDFQTTIVRDLPELSTQDLQCYGIEDALPIHRTADQVVSRCALVGIDLESRMAHEQRERLSHYYCN